MEDTKLNLTTNDETPPAVPPAPSPPSKPPKWPYMSYLEAILLSVAFLVLQVVIGVILAIAVVVIGLALGYPAAENPALTHPGVFMLANIWAVLPLFVWGWVRSGESLPDAFGLKPFPKGALLAILPLGTGAALLMSELDNLTRSVIPLPSFFPELFDSLFSAPLLGFLVVVVMAPLTEEPLFRGIVLRGLLRRHGAGASCVVSALLFALIHLNPPQLLPAFLLGLLLAGVYLRTKSLWPCVGLHAVINCVPLGAFGLFSSEIQGLTTPPEAGAFHPAWLDALAVALFAVGAVAFLQVTHSANPAETKPEPQDP